MLTNNHAVGCTLVALMVAASLALAQQPPAESLLKVGFAERDISPEIGMEKPGGYGKSFHSIFHDPCKVRASVFDDGNKRVALVGIDSLIIPRHLVLAVRKEIHEKCGIDPDAVLIGASHSHSSGPVGMVQPGEYDHADDFVKWLAYEKSSLADPKYLKIVHDALVDAVVAADRDKTELRCGVGSGHEDQVAFNRRFRMTNGLTFTHPGPGNPEIQKVAGPTDPEVGVIGAWDEQGKLIGCVVNFACHGTASPPGISANWIYYLEQTIRGVFGEHVIVVFLNGNSGDVTQVDNLSPFARRTGKDAARFVGGRVGAEAVKVLYTMHAGALGPVDYRTKVTQFGRRIPTPQRVKHAYEIARADPKTVNATEWTFAKEIVMLDAIIKARPTEEVEVQAVQVGPAVFVTNPAEFFCQFGLDIKAGVKDKFPFVYPVSLANGCVGYVPTEEALSEGGGGYETRLTAYSNLEVTAGRTIADTGIQLARQMTAGAIPQPRRVNPFTGNPWSYGSVPPERN